MRGAEATALRSLALGDLGLSPALLAAMQREDPSGHGSTATATPSRVLLLSPPASVCLLSEPSLTTPCPLSEFDAECLLDAVVDLGAVPSAWWTGDPATMPASAELAANIARVATLLRPGGRFFFACRAAPQGPLYSFLAPAFEICAEKDGGVWVWNCCRRAVTLETPAQGAVLMQLGGPSLGGGSNELCLWTRNPAEAALMHREIFIEECYTPDGVPSGDGQRGLIVVDAGMNLGLFTIFLQRRGVCGHCLAFEPAPETYRLALANLRSHGVRVIDHGPRLPASLDNEIADDHADDLIVHTFQLALSARPFGETEAFRFYPLTSANSGLVRLLSEDVRLEGAAAVEMDVPCCRLSEALRAVFGEEAVAVDLLKADVEGAELELLRGLDAIHMKQLDQVAVEVESAAQLEAVHAFLESAAYPGALAASEHPELPGLFLVRGRRRAAVAAVAGQ